jgi:glycosyltransferase involved in cell wall biosynthesis
MRVALLSTCAVSVPPIGYGGTELITAELAKGLTRLGHEVIVYATGDSRPAGSLRYRFAKPVWPPDDLAELRHAAFAWNHIASQGRPFDVVHTHQAPSIAFAAMHEAPTVLTIHHERDASLLDFYLDFPDVRYVAISRRQAENVPELRLSDVVHHGLDPDLYAPGPGDGGYCAFLGRLAREKGPHAAIDAAVSANIPLRIGGAPHWKDRAYFEAEVAPRLSRNGAIVTSLGELGHAPKVDLLRHARALLFPIDWEEPFGLVMIEAMLVGTPVIAFARGSVPEVVEEGVTGFVVHDVEEMAARLREIGGIDRTRCRARAVERWSSTRMAQDYVALYEDVARGRRGAPRIRMWGEGEGTAKGEPRPSLLPTVEEPPQEPRRPSDLYVRSSGTGRRRGGG